VIAESDLHSEKQNEPRISTLLGIKMNSSDDFENADDSIRVNCECDSKIIDKNDLQFEKLDEPKILTLAGITIE
jgi:hypothetical protein